MECSLSSWPRGPASLGADKLLLVGIVVPGFIASTEMALNALTAKARYTAAKPQRAMPFCYRLG